MQSAFHRARPQAWSKLRAHLGALPVLVSLLLVMLQAAMPLAHAHMHMHSARGEHAQARQLSSLPAQVPAWSATAADERLCPLCAIDHAPALPGNRPAQTQIASMPASAPALLARVLSSAPLDVFCRPPPAV